VRISVPITNFNVGMDHALNGLRVAILYQVVLVARMNITAQDTVSGIHAITENVLHTTQYVIEFSTVRITAMKMTALMSAVPMNMLALLVAR